MPSGGELAPVDTLVMVSKDDAEMDQCWFHRPGIGGQAGAFLAGCDQAAPGRMYGDTELTELLFTCAGQGSSQTTVIGRDGEVVGVVKRPLFARSSIAGGRVTATQLWGELIWTKLLGLFRRGESLTRRSASSMPVIAERADAGPGSAATPPPGVRLDTPLDAYVDDASGAPVLLLWKGGPPRGALCTLQFPVTPDGRRLDWRLGVPIALEMRPRPPRAYD